jgi:hypothetical protein
VYQFEIGKIDNTEESQRRLLDVLSAKLKTTDEIREITVFEDTDTKHR